MAAKLRDRDSGERRQRPAADRGRLRSVVERVVAVSYGLSYDIIVRSFQPYQALLREVANLVDRAAAGKPPAEVAVLDVACGTGTLAFDLARRGYSVVGIDAVERLVRIASARSASVAPSRPAFHHADAADAPFPGIGTYDVLVSMHTLYWHPDPTALLVACRRALRPGGHALFLTYCRPARVLHTFLQVRAAHGVAAAVHALRWLVPTALFEMLRGFQPRYMTQFELHEALSTAGFQVLESRRTFLADLSLLAWARAEGTPGESRSAHQSIKEVNRIPCPMLGESNSFGLA